MPLETASGFGLRRASSRADHEAPCRDRCVFGISNVSIVDADGGVVREDKVLSEPEALVPWFAAYGAPMERIGLEGWSSVAMVLLNQKRRVTSSVDRRDGTVRQGAGAQTVLDLKPPRWRPPRFDGPRPGKAEGWVFGSGGAGG